MESDPEAFSDLSQILLNTFAVQGISWHLLQKSGMSHP